MKQHKWSIQRQVVPKENVQRKWDLAYQCLLKWAKAIRDQEVQNESRDLRSCINARSSRNSDN